MAAGSDEATQAPPRERVKDVVQYLRAVKRFWPDGSRTHVTSLDFDDTGELAILSRSDDTIQIYNIKEGKHAKELKSQKYGVDLVRFSHHSQSIIHASTKIDDTIRYLSTHDNSYMRYFRGHEGRVTSLSMCPSKDEFLSCSEDGTMRLWSIQSQNAKGVLKLHGAHLGAYDPSASVIACASGLTQSILLYDLRNFDKQPFATFDLDSMISRFDPSGAGRNWTSLSFSNDGKSIMLGTSGAGHFVLDGFEGSLRHFLKRRGPSQRRAPGELGSTATPGQGDVCFSPDGQFVLGGSGSDDGVSVWDIRGADDPERELKPVAQLPFPDAKKDRVEIAVYNPRFNMLCTADRAVSMWVPDKELYGKPSS
ncbi:WD repeat-containing protein 82 [Microthyrium microscopicum]|uniref:WD repeat-containing protein 82 n=1 Tax=Microthyrium microscopicum TaxID=703497 RepID=A0A6A6U7Q2_9PEZI|nr:WD repeat-containing protein 82 [Microthyrium microscopicum]